MARGEQIDKISKAVVKLTARKKKAQKHAHKRFLRRQRKSINKPHPDHNRYAGFIG